MCSVSYLALTTYVSCDISRYIDSNVEHNFGINQYRSYDVSHDIDKILHVMYRLIGILAVPSAVTSAAVTAYMPARRLKQSVKSRM